MIASLEDHMINPGCYSHVLIRVDQVQASFLDHCVLAISAGGAVPLQQKIFSLLFLFSSFPVVSWFFILLCCVGEWQDQ